MPPTREELLAKAEKPSREALRLLDETDPKARG